MSMKVLREGPVKITRSKIDAVWRQRRPKQRLVVSDADCRGLALVVHATSMTWRFDYKPRGIDQHSGKRFSSRSVTIGNPQTHSPDDARAEANKLKGMAKAGKDPAAHRQASILEKARKRGQTMQRILDEYSKALPTRNKLRGGQGVLAPRGAAYEIAHAKAAIDDMKANDRPSDEITALHIKKMLEYVSDRPATARHRYGALSRLFDWAQEEGMIASNPCMLVAKARRPRPVKARSVFHSPKQLAELWSAVETATGLNRVHRDLMQFLIAIPCRRSEAAKMCWENVDLANASWQQTGADTKNGDPHRLYLHPLALGILLRHFQEMGKPSSGLIFPAPRSGKAIETFSDMKQAVDEALTRKFEWRFHDHRRSFVTALGEAGVHEAVVDSILNHRQSATRGGVLGVYQQAQRWPEQVTAMKKWGEFLSDAIDNNPESITATNAD